MPGSASTTCIRITLPLSGRQGAWGGEAESWWWPVHSRGLVRQFVHHSQTSFHSSSSSLESTGGLKLWFIELARKAIGIIGCSKSPSCEKPYRAQLSIRKSISSQNAFRSDVTRSHSPSFGLNEKNTSDSKPLVISQELMQMEKSTCCVSFSHYRFTRE